MTQPDSHTCGARIEPTTRRESLSDYGLSDTNTPINCERLLYKLSESYTGSMEQVKAIIKVLQDNPDRESDKKPIMRKSHLDSSIKSTTGQALGDVIDNMPYYVDSCAWWLKGWDLEKYKKAVIRRAKIFKSKPKKRVFSKCSKYLKAKEL